MFECFRQSIFASQFLSVDTCRCVYLPTVVTTLLHGSETWAVKARQVQHLEVFIIVVLGESWESPDFSNGESIFLLGTWLCDLGCPIDLVC